MKAIWHLFKAKTNVFETDFLANDIKRQCAEPVVHAPHDPSQHGAVAHPRVEQAQRRGFRMQMRQLHAGAFGHHPLFTAGIDEHQIFLPVVVKSKRGLSTVVLGGARLNHRGVDSLTDLIIGIGERGSTLADNIFLDPGHGRGSDALAVAQPADEFAVIDRLAAEGALGNSLGAAERLDLFDQLMIRSDLNIHAGTQYSMLLA